MGLWQTIHGGGNRSYRCSGNDSTSVFTPRNVLVNEMKPLGFVDNGTPTGTRDTTFSHENISNKPKKTDTH